MNLSVPNAELRFHTDDHPYDPLPQRGHRRRRRLSAASRICKKLAPGEKSLLDRLPNFGNPKANWQQNAGVLREEMRLGMPIRDASPGDTAGQFLNAERGPAEGSRLDVRAAD